MPSRVIATTTATAAQQQQQHSHQSNNSNLAPVITVTTHSVFTQHHTSPSHHQLGRCSWLQLVRYVLQLVTAGYSWVEQHAPQQCVIIYIWSWALAVRRWPRTQVQQVFIPSTIKMRLHNLYWYVANKQARVSNVHILSLTRCTDSVN